MYTIKQSVRCLFLLGLFVTALLFSNSTKAQVKIGLNSTKLDKQDSSAVLSLEDPTRGFLPPRMTLNERDAMVTPGPATGLVVFVRDNIKKDTGLYVNYGTNTKPFWVKLTNSVKDTLLISRIDTIINKVIHTDSIFSNSGRIDTIYNMLIKTDSIFSNSARIDTIYNKISRVDTLFAKTAHFDTVTIGKLKVKILGKSTDKILVVDKVTDSLKWIPKDSLLSSIPNGKIDTLVNLLLRTDSIFSNSGRIDTIYNKISRIDTLFAKSAHFDTVTIGKLKITKRGNYLTDSIVVVAPNDSLKKISYKQFITALGKDTVVISRIDTIINKVIQTDSIFSNSGRIDTIYSKISRVDTLFAKTAHFDTVTIGKLKITKRGNYLTDSIVVVAPNDSLKKISYKQFIAALGKDTVVISRIDTIINKVIQTDSIFSNSGKIDTIYSKIARLDTLFAKSAHFDTVTIGKLKVKILGKSTDKILVVDKVTDSLKWIPKDSLLSTVGSGKIDTLINLLLRTDSIFSNSGRIDTIYNTLIKTDSIFSNSGKIDTIYSKIARLDTLFAKTAHFDTVTIGKLKVKILGKSTDKILVVDKVTDSLKWIPKDSLLSTVGSGKIDTLINLLLRTDSIFSNSGRIDTIYNTLIKTDSIFSNSARIDTIYNKISRVDTLFAKTAHFDTVTIGKLKIRLSGKITDSIVVVDPATDSVKRISASRLIVSSVANDSSIYSYDGTIQNRNMVIANTRTITKGTNTLQFIGTTVANKDTVSFNGNGSVGIGTSNPQYKLDVRGYAYSDTVVTKAIKLINPSGGFSGYGISTNWGLTTVSDQRLKENIKPYGGADALKGINSIEIVEYDWKAAKPGDPNRHMPIGVIAQNVQKVFPDAVEFDSQSGNLTLRSSLFPYYLMKATQELSKQMEEEKAKNATLQKQVDEQGLRIQKLEQLVNQLMQSKK